eukprot:g15289.t1
MVVIPAGRFLMGRDDGLEDEGPATAVTIAAPFALGRLEVTIGEYEACVAAGACMARRDRAWFDARADRERFPITLISVNNFRLYLAWLTGKTGRAYRLPSEAEWEWAASGGVPGPRWWGAADAAAPGGGRARARDGARDGPAIPPGAVNCRGCPGEDWRGLAPTGSFPPNPFGLHDMLGNVAEFAADCWRDSHAGRPATGAIYSPCETYLRSLRGAAWTSRTAFVNRYTRAPFPSDGAARGDFGFRVARNLTPAERGAAGE